MNVIICGAGKVGNTIARQLLRDGNMNITIIDSSPERIQSVRSLDVRTVLGFSSHPAVLAEAGAEKCDIIIAVTLSDEINMLTCHVAHSIFKVPSKIARVRDAHYLDPKWKIFDENNLFVDFAISPEIAVSQMISQHVKMPGAESYAGLYNDDISLFSLIIKKNMHDRTIANVYQLLQNSDIEDLTFVAIRRYGRIFLIKKRMDDIRLQEEDEVYILSGKRSVSRVLSILSGVSNEGYNIVICGGGNIGYSIADILQYKMNVTVVDKSAERISFLTQHLDSINIIQGDMMDMQILKEANVESASSVICVSDKDEVNVMSSMVAKYMTKGSVFTLVSDYNYKDILVQNGMLNIINPRDVTISKILSYINRHKLTNDVSIFDGEYNVCEVNIKQSSRMIGLNIEQIESRFISINAVIRESRIFYKNFDSSFVVRKGDTLIITCEFEEFKNLESLIG